MRNLRLILLLSIFLSGFFQIQAQRTVNPSLESPYHAMLTHLYYLQTDTYRPDIASITIHPSDVPDSLTRVRRAIRLKRVLDGKGLYVQLSRIPRNPNYIDSVSSSNVYTPFPKKLPEVYLERIDSMWYYSSSTVETIPTLYAQVYPLGLDNVVSLFPKWANQRVLGLKLWQYFSIAILMLVAYLFFLIFKLLIRPLVNKILKKYTKELFIRPKIIKSIVRVVSLFFIVWLVKLFVPALQLPVKYTEFVQKGLSIFMSILIAILLFRIVEIIIAYFERIVTRTDHKMDDQALPILERVLKMIVVFAAIIHVLSTLNVNVTALIAGISIGGLAIALAAQDTVKNLIGSVMIFFDRPFQIGDYISGDGFEGTIMEVGFRSTRIQTIDTSITSVPNGNLANMSVKNLGVRHKRIINIKIGITYNTPPAIMKAFTDGLKEIKDIHPGVADEPFHIRFIEFGPSALLIMFRVYIETQEFDRELFIKEEVNYSILQLAETLGVSFAYPSSSVYIESTPENPSVPRNLSDAEIKARMEGFYKSCREKFLDSEV